ncbi:hypothetical protein BCR35DRAFT_300024 [Leucosporidium creatinivorum]|uniref:Uncharacterized protein n=1 Tax=Leucosporidium creatinivorum TaxID=106004 RepID=A0A1Y2G209_9BASI|nr:hypothetical protein BCR35DRAFT_300024 [Leucosporidium creatinivorum]
MMEEAASDPLPPPTPPALPSPTLPTSRALPASRTAPPSYIEHEGSPVTVYFTFDPYTAHQPLASFTNGPFHSLLRGQPIRVPTRAFPVTFHSPRTLRLLEMFDRTIFERYPSPPSSYPDTNYKETSRSIEYFEYSLGRGPLAAFRLRVNDRFDELTGAPADAVNWPVQRRNDLYGEYRKNRIPSAMKRSSVEEWAEVCVLMALLEVERECRELWQPMIEWHRQATQELEARLKVLSSRRDKDAEKELFNVDARPPRWALPLTFYTNSKPTWMSPSRHPKEWAKKMKAYQQAYPPPSPPSAPPSPELGQEQDVEGPPPMETADIAPPSVATADVAPPQKNEAAPSPSRKEPALGTPAPKQTTTSRFKRMLQRWFF